MPSPHTLFFSKHCSVPCSHLLRPPGTPPELVAVPTHYFKVVLADAGDGSASVGAFVMPNAEIQADTPLTAFVVPLDALERVSGVAFFPGYVDASRRAVLDDVALDWQVGGVVWQCNGCFERGAVRGVVLSGVTSTPGLSWRLWSMPVIWTNTQHTIVIKHTIAPILHPPLVFRHMARRPYVPKQLQHQNNRYC